MNATANRYRLFETPTGPFALVGDDRPRFTMWVETTTAMQLEEMEQDATLLESVADRLMRYFEGDEVEFADIPTPDGPRFHHRCWEACRAIPRGRTRSYRELATAAGHGPSAARAAGQAMRHNPLPIIIPCHRVVASAGPRTGLGGFAGCDDAAGMTVSIKRHLLEMEGAAVRQ